MRRRFYAIATIAGGLAGVCAGQTSSSRAVAQWTGADFAGGAKDRFGAVKEGAAVNYVYAEPTGAAATMRHTFSVSTVPGAPLFLHLEARDDDGPASCRIAIQLNGTTLLDGPNPFPADRWHVQRFAIPPDVLHAGENTLVITNRESTGRFGMPPWFMVASCAIGPESCDLRPDIARDFRVTLPDRQRELPEPLSPGQSPGFAWRGTKGWFWTPRQYLAEIPVLAKYRMNFLMNCYGSMCDVEHYRWGDPRVNRWWEPLPESKKAAYAEVVRACQELGITFCFSMNPNLCSTRFASSGDPRDVDALYQHYAWMQSLGVQWFNISLDDITQGIDATSQARVVNEILRRLRANDADAQMIFCPTYYWGDGTGAEQQPYLETLARELHDDVYLFWTGDAVVGRITRPAAETFRRISGHRLILWDNYPVNDDHPTMHLGPVTGRDPDLCEVVDGYMSNPHCRQNEGNRLPLLTCADFAWNPRAYDPARSIGQAILHLADTPAQRDVLRDLVEAYPGMLIYGQGPAFNAVHHKYAQLAALPHSKLAAAAYIDYLGRLAERMRRAFPNGYAAERETLERDVAELQRMHAAKYGL